MWNKIRNRNRDNILYNKEILTKIDHCFFISFKLLFYLKQLKQYHAAGTLATFRHVKGMLVGQQWFRFFKHFSSTF